MFPLSPPTDSLYKFISLFGLAIFILASYKSGKAFEALTVNKVEMEVLKKDIRVAIAHHYAGEEKERADTPGAAAIMTAVKQLPDDADAIMLEVEKAPLPLKTRIAFDGEVKKIKARGESLHIRFIECIVILSAGIMLIVLGFMLWYKRDQVLKDKLLKADLEKRMIKHREEMMTPRIPVI